MIALLFTVSLPYLRAHAGRILLTLLGVIIGVQGMVAMGALNHSIIKSFEAGLEAIAGTARLQIAGPETGIPDTLAEDALKVPGVESAVAIVDGSLTLPDDPTVRIRTFGIDLLGMVGTRSPQFPREHVHIADELRFVNATDSIALGAPLMSRLGVAVGDTVRLATPGGVKPYVVRGTLDDIGPTKLFGGLVALMDLPTAESVFLAPGLAQTIYVSLKPDAALDDVFAKLSAAIGDRARVERTEARGQQMDALLGSIRVALSLASLVTMIAAFFIIYETIAISVEQRRREIAIARSLGFTKRAVAGVFILESVLLGLAGAIGGVLGGYLLARASLATAAAGVSGMYFPVAPGNVVIPLNATLFAVALGTTVCALAGAIPTFDAASAPPAQVLRSEAGVSTERLPIFSFGIGFILIACSIFILRADVHTQNTFSKTAWIMLGHSLLLVGVSSMAPAYARLAARIFSSFKNSRLLAIGLACDFFSRRPHRVAATATAIGIGYALVVVLGSVVQSIEGTLGNWITQTFGAELTVGMSPGLNSGSFEGQIADDVEKVPGVQAVERYKKGLVIFDGHPVVLAAFDRHNRPDRQPLLISEALPKAYEQAEEGSAVFISESFGFRYQYQLGDSLELATAQGTKRFLIGAIVRDYTMDLGTVLVDINVYQRLWQDTRLTYIHVWPSVDADVSKLRNAASQIVSGSPGISVVTNAEFRAEVEGRVRDLLKVLGSLQIFACAVAVLGVVNFLLAAILDRRREISLLRTVGVTVGQIRGTVMLEGGLVGLTGATLGLAAGFPAAYFMVKHSMPVAMGWSLDFRFPTVLAGTTIVSITIAAALAAYVPARRLTQGAVLTGLQTE